MSYNLSDLWETEEVKEEPSKVVVKRHVKPKTKTTPKRTSTPNPFTPIEREILKKSLLIAKSSLNVNVERMAKKGKVSANKPEIKGMELLLQKLEAMK